MLPIATAHEVQKFDNPNISNAYSRFGEELVLMSVDEVQSIQTTL
jgi:hypothetical protein